MENSTGSSVIAGYIVALLAGVLIGGLTVRSCGTEYPKQITGVKSLPPLVTAKSDSSLQVVPKQPVKAQGKGRAVRVTSTLYSHPVVVPTNEVALQKSNFDSAFVATFDTLKNGTTIHVEYVYPQNIFTVEVQCSPDTSRIIERIVTVAQPIEIIKKEEDKSVTLTEKGTWACIGAGVLAIIVLVFGG